MLAPDVLFNAHAASPPVWFDTPVVSDISTLNVSDSPKGRSERTPDSSESPPKGSPRTYNPLALSDDAFPTCRGSSIVPACRGESGRAIVVETNQRAPRRTAVRRDIPRPTGRPRAYRFDPRPPYRGAFPWPDRRVVWIAARTCVRIAGTLGIEGVVVSFVSRFVVSRQERCPRGRSTSIWIERCHSVVPIGDIRYRLDLIGHDRA